MLLAALALIAAYYQNKKSDAFKLAVVLYTVATVYYLSFFLVAQRHEVRYFFPSAYIYVLLIGMSIVIISSSCNYVWVTPISRFIKNRRDQLCNHAITILLAAILLWIFFVALLPRVLAIRAPQHFNIIANPLSDMNWEGGVSLRDGANIILIESSPRNVALTRSLHSRSTIFNGTSTATIEKVVFKGNQWIHIVIKEPDISPIEWGHPRTLSVSRN